MGMTILSRSAEACRRAGWAGSATVAVLLAGASADGQQVGPAGSAVPASQQEAGLGRTFDTLDSNETAPLSGGGFQASRFGPRPGGLHSAPYPEYRIGSHDLIDVSVYEAPEFQRSVRVGPHGTVRLPMCKDSIRVAGLTYIEAEQVIAQALVDEGLLVDPLVAVYVREPHGNPVRVTGSVRQTGCLSSRRPHNLTRCHRAGGRAREPGPGDSGDPAAVKTASTPRPCASPPPNSHKALTALKNCPSSVEKQFASFNQRRSL